MRQSGTNPEESVDPLESCKEGTPRLLCYFKWFDRAPKLIQKILRLVIPFLVLIFFLLLPMNISNEIRAMLAIFFCVALLWTLEPVPLAVTALIVPVLLVALGVATPVQSLQSFADPIIYLLMGGLIIAESFRVNGLDRRAALYLVAKMGGDVRKVLLALMLVTTLLSMWISNTATIALLLPVAAGVASKVVGQQPKVLAAFLLGMGMAGMFGGMATITGSPPNAIVAALISQEEPFSFLNWMTMGVPVSISLFAIAFFLLPRLMRISSQVIDIAQVHKELVALGSWSHGEKSTLLIFFPTVLLWLLGDRLGGVFGLPSNFFVPAMVALLSSFLLFVVKALKWEQAKGISWEIFLIVGAGLSLGKALEYTGTAALIADLIVMGFRGMSVIAMMIFVGVISVLITNFVSNTASAAMLAPIMIGVSSALGIDPKYLALTVGFCVSLAIITPIGTPSMTLIYSTGQVSRKAMAAAGLVVSALAVPLIVAIVYIMVNSGWA
ncbi:MAG: DASS family sodium-coupled anion symporter [Methanomassiliicoccales archaeon]